MKRPLAYITAAWLGGDSENAEQAARYCRAVYEAGFSPICPPLYLPLFLNDAIPEEPRPPAEGSVVIYPPSPPIFLYSREWAVKGATHRRLRRPALYGLPRLCYFQRRGGGYISSRAAPFPMTGKGRGDWAEVSFFNEWRF